MPKIIIFNIQKLTTINKLSSFFNHIQQQDPDIIGFTEYDSPPNESLQQSITTLLQSQNFTALPSLPKSRVHIVVKSTFLSSITSQNTFRQHFPPPYNCYLQDFNFTFDGTPTSFILVYIPSFRNHLQTTTLTTITQQEFLEVFESNLRQHTPISPCFAGDWNTAPTYPIFTELALLGCKDCTTKLPPSYAKKPTNISATGENRRLDRFYIHNDVLGFHTIKYRVLNKLPFSTHHPVMLNIRTRARRKQRNTTGENVIFSSSSYTQRQAPFPHHIIQDHELMASIFKPTPLWADNISLSFSYYSEMINSRLQKIKQMIRQVAHYNPTREALRANYRQSHSANLLSTTYKELNKRFKSKLAQTTFSAATIDRAYDLFSSIYEKNTALETTDISNLFTASFSSHITKSLTTAECNQLIQPFQSEEILANLKLLCSKGPSSPGPDGITYQAWSEAWPYAAPHITSFANHTLSGPTTTTLPYHNIFDSLIKLIPKKDFDPNNPNPKHLRPISLTNSIFRLISFSITVRIMPILNRVISPHQQAFLQQRDMHLHIQTAKFLAHQLNTHPNNLNSILLLDIEKAFDSLSHDYISIILQKYGIPDSLIRSIQYQTGVGQARLLNGKHVFKKRIAINRGVRQGLPLSPLIFNLCLEPLILKLQHQLRGIIYNPLHVETTHQLHHQLTITTTIQAFADDLAIFAKDQKDIKECLQIAHTFKQISGLHLNEKKTKIYCHQNNVIQLQESLRTPISITSILENPVYLGVPLLHFDWESKLETLVAKTKRILILDLPIHLRTLGINTYIYSTIFFQDQHSPIPAQLLQRFITSIKQLLSSHIYPSFQLSRNLWYTPRQLGGLGLLDLPTQLLGRRAYFTFYTLFPDLSASCHPTLHRLYRLSLQAHMYHKQNLHNIQRQIFEVMQQHISNRCQIFTIPTTFLQEHRIPINSNTPLIPWYQPFIQEHNFPSIPFKCSVSTMNGTLTLNYSQHYRNELHDVILEEHMRIEQYYLQHQQIPPPMEPYGAPADLTLPSDQIIAIPIPTPQPLFANVLHYLRAWQKITQRNSQPVELSATPLSTLANPLRPSNFQLQDQFSENNTPIPLTTADDLNHLSMKLHWQKLELLKASYTWRHISIENQQWSQFFKVMSSQIFCNPNHYYWLYALNAGYLNNTFYKPCLCGLALTAESPIKHVFHHCTASTSIWNFLYPGQLYPRVICPTSLNMQAIQQLHNFIGFTFHLHRTNYARVHNDENGIDLEDEDELQEIYFHFTSAHNRF